MYVMQPHGPFGLVGLQEMVTVFDGAHYLLKAVSHSRPKKSIVLTTYHITSNSAISATFILTMQKGGVWRLKAGL